MIAGLGNPGVEYTETRHNIGFKVLDAFAKASNLVFEHKRYADMVECKIKGRIYVLIKPITYMNLSGKAVKYWLKEANVPIENLMIISDDLALPFGTIRIKANGSAGGHNGLSHISEILETENYSRLRFGIGNSFSKGKQIDYVLGNWDTEEKKFLEQRIEKVIQAIKNFGTIGIERTMNHSNEKFDLVKELEKQKTENISNKENE